jgi:hypothetical protein
MTMLRLLLSELAVEAETAIAPEEARQRVGAETAIAPEEARQRVGAEMVIAPEEARQSVGAEMAIALEARQRVHLPVRPVQPPLRPHLVLLQLVLLPVQRSERPFCPVQSGEPVERVPFQVQFVQSAVQIVH